MRMSRKSALVAGAGMAVAFLAACSDSPTAPSARVNAPAPSFALLQQPNLVQGEFKVCSANASATFSVTFSDALGTRLSPPLASTSSPTTLSVAAGTCAIIWSKTTPTTTPADQVTTATIVQTGQAAGYQFQMVEVLDAGSLGSSADNATQTATLKSNAFHGATATFTQELIPSNTCTYTKGYYRNHPNAVTGTIGGRAEADAEAILAATPGKPGDVTFQDDNSLLNLYQQYLSALINGGTSGPLAVQDAIATVAGGTGGSGKAITNVSLTKAQISSLTDTLSSFNEGSFNGWPHCE